IVGAMTSSMLLSLLTVPVFYSLLDDLKEFLRALFSKPAPVAVPETAPVALGPAVPEVQLAGGNAGDGDGAHGSAPRPTSPVREGVVERRSQ
ncbi:MAG: hypothetical protein HY510_07770, partial [Acidobacteria bacterium]|nr:hypothetical protein [Acidobacteriota bacterium]